MKFQATLGTLVYVISISCFIIFAAISYVMFNRPEVSMAYKTFVVVFIWLVFVFCYLYHPASYSINATNVYVHRPVSKLTIPRNEILEFRLVSDEDMKWTIRTFGVGGLFGYFGKFTNTVLGGMTWYATQRRNYVLLVLAGKRIILTPDKPEEFIAMLK